MSLFQHDNPKIINDARWLQPLSDPPTGKPLCRDVYLKAMALYVSEVFRTGKARNLFIFGKPGTGKTLCMKYLLREILRHASKSKVCLAVAYVNAGRTRTPYYTMLEIVRQLGFNVPTSGWQMTRLKQAFESRLNEKPVVIGIDEVDALLSKQREPVIYYLNRQPRTTLILVSNNLEDAATLPRRALSTLQPKLLALQPYTAEEAKTILKERVEKAFNANTISDKLLEIVAETASKTGDIRAGFSILLTAGRIAEEKGKSRVEADDLQLAIESETRIELLQKLTELNKKIKAFQRQGIH